VGANYRTLALFVKEAKAQDKYTVYPSLWTSRTPPSWTLFDALFIMDKETIADIKNQGRGHGSLPDKSWVPGDKGRVGEESGLLEGGQAVSGRRGDRHLPDYNTLVINVESGAVHMGERSRPTTSSETRATTRSRPSSPAAATSSTTS